VNPPSDRSILSARPFSGRLEIDQVESVGAAFSHSGTAFFVTTRDGRRFKLRECSRRGRARSIERYVRALPDLFPRLVARDGRYLLMEALDEYRLVSRTELVRGADRLGRMSALAHREAHTNGLAGGVRGWAVAALSRHRFFRELSLLRRRGTLPAVSCSGAARKFRSHHARFGLPIALELDDLHKGNVMIRESDGDLRYVDEEGIRLRPKGTGMASLLKTATTTRTLELYRKGYAEIGDADFITPEYTEYLLLMDAVRRVAFKVRTEGRLEKLPREIGELREMADTVGLALDWRFPRG